MILNVFRTSWPVNPDLIMLSTSTPLSGDFWECLKTFSVVTTGEVLLTSKERLGMLLYILQCISYYPSFPLKNHPTQNVSSTEDEKLCLGRICLGNLELSYHIASFSYPSMPSPRRVVESWWVIFYLWLPLS